MKSAGQAEFQLIIDRKVTIKPQTLRQSKSVVTFNINKFGFYANFASIWQRSNGTIGRASRELPSIVMHSCKCCQQRAISECINVVISCYLSIVSHAHTSLAPCTGGRAYVTKKSLCWWHSDDRIRTHVCQRTPQQSPTHYIDTNINEWTAKQGEQNNISECDFKRHDIIVWLRVARRET